MEIRVTSERLTYSDGTIAQSANDFERSLPKSMALDPLEAFECQGWLLRDNLEVDMLVFSPCASWLTTSRPLRNDRLPSSIACWFLNKRLIDRANFIEDSQLLLPMYQNENEAFSRKQKPCPGKKDMSKCHFDILQIKNRDIDISGYSFQDSYFIIHQKRM